MELTLSFQSDTIVTVACDGQPSHTFDLLSLTPDEHVPGRPPQPLEDPVGYGQAVYAALFPRGTLAREMVEHGVDRLLLVAVDNALDAVPWEYAHDGNDFIVLDVPFVR